MHNLLLIILAIGGINDKIYSAINQQAACNTFIKQSEIKNL